VCREHISPLRVWVHLLQAGASMREHHHTCMYSREHVCGAGVLGARGAIGVLIVEHVAREDDRDVRTSARTTIPWKRMLNLGRGGASHLLQNSHFNPFLQTFSHHYTFSSPRKNYCENASMFPPPALQSNIL